MRAAQWVVPKVEKKADYLAGLWVDLTADWKADWWARY